ncbi:MAG: ribbon-helix-helix domain-containing protein, partial [Candidatus Bathyarchaeia archaeon]
NARTYLEHIFSITYRSITKKEHSVTMEGLKMKMITLYLPEPYLEALDQLVNEKFYPNRAEAIRVAIRDLINNEVRRRRRAS